MPLPQLKLQVQLDYITHKLHCSTLQLQIQLQLHYITQHYATLITLHYNYNYNCNYSCSYHYITLCYTTLRYTNYITLHYANYITLHYTRLHYTIPQYSTQHYTTLHKYTTPRLQLQLHYTNHTTLQLQLRYTTLQLQLHYTTLHPAVVVRWPLQPLQPLQKTQLQPPVGPSVDSLCHP